MVIISAGVRSNLELAGPLGLDFEKGIKGDGESEWNPWYDGNAGDGDANNDHEKWKQEFHNLV